MISGTLFDDVTSHRKTEVFQYIVAIYVSYVVGTRIAIFPLGKLSFFSLLDSFGVLFKDGFSYIFLSYKNLSFVNVSPNSTIRKFTSLASNSFWTTLSTFSTIAFHEISDLLCKRGVLNLLYSVNRLLWCPWYTFKNSKISVYVSPA